MTIEKQLERSADAFEDIASPLQIFSACAVPESEGGSAIEEEVAEKPKKKKDKPKAKKEKKPEPVDEEEEENDSDEDDGDEEEDIVEEKPKKKKGKAKAKKEKEEAETSEDDVKESVRQYLKNPKHTNKKAIGLLVERFDVKTLKELTSDQREEAVEMFEEAA